MSKSSKMNNTPQLVFRRSWLYDRALVRKKDYIMPGDKVLDAHVRKLEGEWRKYGQKILKEIARATKLQWHERDITCYVTAGVIPYSDPLTLNTRSDVHTISHELIHRILDEPENWKKIKKNWFDLMKKYNHEAEKTRGHVIVHAIHGIILGNLFGEKVLEKEKEVVKDPLYIRAWELADRDGYTQIVQRLTKGFR